jgi:hypothetical protein
MVLQKEEVLFVYKVPECAEFNFVSSAGSCTIALEKKESNVAHVATR